MRTIKLYVATDQDGTQCVYRQFPICDEEGGRWLGDKEDWDNNFMILPDHPFSQSWEDAPIEIELGEGCLVPKDIFAKLKELGMLPNDVRSHNVGNSDYSAHFIQPWAIWQDHNLNAWDGDIIKRTLRTKAEKGLTMEESRIMDYEKIIHNCEERIRQLQNK